MTGKSNILLRDGLLQRLGILLPKPALPIRLHECRNYGGRAGSYDTNLNGITVRLSDDRSENLEDGFPASNPISIRGQQLPTFIYAFKRGKAESYKNAEGIIFTVNGQTHGLLPQHFFGRKTVGLDRLRGSLLVVVDCTGLEGRLREDLFMNSRDRMEEGELLREIESELEDSLWRHQGLRELRQRRRQEDTAAKLQDSKPFRETLEAIVRKSPALAQLFGGTGTLPNPFRPVDAPGAKPYVGKLHPSVFKFRDLDYGKELIRKTPKNRRSRIAFETDVVNDYFDREEMPGSFAIRPAGSLPHRGCVPNHSLNLNNGVATLNLKLPEDAVEGQSFTYELVVEDDTFYPPFENRFKIEVGPYQSSTPRPGPKPPPPNEPGSGEGTARSGLAIPQPTRVFQADWADHDFDAYSALRVVQDPDGGDDPNGGGYSYYINMDNIYLQNELKASKQNPDLTRARWEFGMMLVALALLRPQANAQGADASQAIASEADDSLPQDTVPKVTAAMAPVLLPLIEHLGALSDDDLSEE